MCIRDRILPHRPYVVANEKAQMTQAMDLRLMWYVAGSIPVKERANEERRSCRNAAQREPTGRFGRRRRGAFDAPRPRRALEGHLRPFEYDGRPGDRLFRLRAPHMADDERRRIGERAVAEQRGQLSWRR